jgi:hypothetical protein
MGPVDMCSGAWHARLKSLAENLWPETVGRVTPASKPAFGHGPAGLPASWIRRPMAKALSSRRNGCIHEAPV